MTLALFLPFFAVAQAAEVSVTEKGHAYNPVWSPNGQYLAFEVNQYEGVIALFVVKVQNGSPVGAPQKVSIPGGGSAFSTGGSVAAAPVWHPEGRLIFEGNNAGGATRMFFWSPGGQSAAELLTVSQISGDLSWATISPDGKKVMFVSDTTGAGDLYLWDRSTNAVTLAFGSAFSEMAPRYDAAGSKVAFTRKSRGSEDVFVLDGAAQLPQAGGNGDQTRPGWSGSSVYFFSNERGDDHWDVVASDSPGNKRTVAKDIRLPLRAPPAISPDGKWLAYAFAEPEKAHGIMLTTVDGARSVSVDTGLVACGEPAITQADGKTFLAFTALPSEGSDWRQLHVLDITDKVK